MASPTERPGHYSHLVTAVKHTPSPWSKTLKYGMITLVIVGVVGGLIAYGLTV